MSASTSPKKTNTDRDDRGRWFLWSILLHVVILAAVVLLTPVRDMIMDEKTRPDLKMTEDRVTELAYHIREQNIEDLKYKIRKLDELERMMERLRRQQREQLDPEQLEEVAEAPKDAAEAIEEAIARQTEALEQLNGLAPEAEPFREQAEQARQKQIDVEVAQEKVVNALALAGPDFEAIRRRQTDVAVEQLHARDAVEQAIERTRELGRIDRRISSEQRSNERLKELAARKAEERAERQRQLDKEQAQLAAHERELAERRDELTEAERAATRAEQARDQVADDRQLNQAVNDAREKSTQAAKQVQRRQAQVDRSRRAVEVSEEQLTKKTNELQRYQRQQAERQAEIDRLEQRRSEAVAARDRQLERAKRTQTQAIEQQKQLLAELDRLRRERADAESADPAERAEQAVAADAPTESALPDDPLELYRQAQRREMSITEDYREIRAAELAKIQRMPLAEAMGQVDVATPSREPLNEAALADPVNTPKKLEAYKREFQRAARQMDGMVSAAEAMALAAQRVGAEMSDELAAAMRIEHSAVMDEYAAENVDAKAVDMARMMAQASAMGMSATGRSESPGPLGGGPAGGPDGDSGDRRASARPTRGVPHPRINHDDIDSASPGRVLAAANTASDAPGAEWVYVDSWYILGPFPNEGRRNIHRRFPPETVVDLDAKYIGRGGRPIEWRYYKSPEPVVVPPQQEEYAIFYAYTELRFEQATDMWIAVGSDDRSDIWINGQKVWASVDRHKGWNPGEGYRKVHFQRGRNEVLYRIENGHMNMGFSLVMHTGRSQ